MLQDYPNKTFTPEELELSISFNTGMKLTIQKFVMNNDLNFYTAPSLAFQVQIGDKEYPIRSFASLVSFEIPGRCVTKIIIVDQKGDYDYSITMVYDIQPL